MKQIEGQLSLFEDLPRNCNEIATKLTCSGCTHFHEVVSGLGDIYHDTACLKDRPWARPKKPEDPACKDYKPKKEG